MCSSGPSKLLLPHLASMMESTSRTLDGRPTGLLNNALKRIQMLICHHLQAWERADKDEPWRRDLEVTLQSLGLGPIPAYRMAVQNMDPVEMLPDEAQGAPVCLTTWADRSYTVIQVLTSAAHTSYTPSMI